MERRPRTIRRLLLLHLCLLSLYLLSLHLFRVLVWLCSSSCDLLLFGLRLLTVLLLIVVSCFGYKNSRHVSLLIFVKKKSLCYMFHETTR